MDEITDGGGGGGGGGIVPDWPALDIAAQSPDSSGMDTTGGDAASDSAPAFADYSYGADAQAPEQRRQNAGTDYSTNPVTAPSAEDQDTPILPTVSQGYSDYVSPATYNNYEKPAEMPKPSVMDWVLGRTPRVEQFHPPYDIPGMEAAAENRRTEQQVADMWGGAVPQATDAGTANFDPNVPLDPSQVIDKRSQPSAPSWQTYATAGGDSNKSPGDGTPRGMSETADAHWQQQRLEQAALSAYLEAVRRLSRQ